MKTAAEVCRDFVEYAKDRGGVGREYGAILDDAKKVVKAAEDSGCLERNLKPGELVDTGMLFQGHGVLILIKATGWPSQGERKLKGAFEHTMNKLLKRPFPCNNEIQC